MWSFGTTGTAVRLAPSRRSVAALGLLVAGAVLAAACGASSDAGTGASPSSPTASAATSAAAGWSPVASASPSQTSPAPSTGATSPSPSTAASAVASPAATFNDPPGQLHRTVTRFTAKPNPKQVAFTPDGRELWVTLLGGKGVQVFDPRTGALLATIPLGTHGGAVEVTFSRDGRTAYASQMESASVFEIDTATRAVRRQLKSSGSWSKIIALSPDESRLYLANWVSNDVSEFDLASGRELRRIKVVRTPRGLYPTPDGRSLYVAGFDGGEIQKIDLATGIGRVLIRTGGAVRHLVADPTRNRLYADDMTLGRVFVVDMTNDTVTRLADVDEMPNTMDLSPDGRVLYVSCRGRNGKSYVQPGPEWGSVVVLDALTGRGLDAMVGGNQPTGLDVSPDGTLLASSDFLDHRVRVYANPSTDDLLAGAGGRYGAHRQDMPKR